jgi:hypothetical protein
MLFGGIPPDFVKVPLFARQRDVLVLVATHIHPLSIPSDSLNQDVNSHHKESGLP